MRKLDKNFSWRSLIYAILYFCYFSCTLQLYIALTGHANFIGLRDSLIYSMIWLVPMLFFPNFTKKYATIYGVIVGGLSLISIGYFTIFRQEFSQSVFFVMAESNYNESHEFISQYLSIKLVAVLLIYSLVGGVLWFKVKPVYVKNMTKWLVSIVIMVYALTPLFISCLLYTSPSPRD